MTNRGDIPPAEGPPSDLWDETHTFQYKKSYNPLFDSYIREDVRKPMTPEREKIIRETLERIMARPGMKEAMQYLKDHGD